MTEPTTAPPAEKVWIERCERCHGFNVERAEQHWYDPNTYEDCDGYHQIDGAYCRDCDRDVYLDSEEVAPEDMPAELAERLREAEAHRRLEAAAPALLAACESALALIRSRFPVEHGSEEIGRAWGELEAAIAKSRGES